MLKEARSVVFPCGVNWLLVWLVEGVDVGQLW